MKPRAILVASVVLMVVLAGCLTIGNAGSDDADGNGVESHATIDVGATASVTSPPDLALVRVAVVVTAPTADEARAAVAENVSGMRDALRAAGIDDDGIETTAYYLRAVYEYPKEGPEVVRYRAEHAFEIETAVDRAGEIVDVAVTNGANRVTGVQFALSEETRREVRAEALALAMANAREDADAIAAAADLEVLDVESASTSNFGYVPFDSRFEGDDRSGGATVIEPGPVRVSVTVAVTYRAA